MWKTNQRMQVIEAALRPLMQGVEGLRPFVCDGDPSTCRIFIVGTNPATGMPQSFWDYWEAERGFNKARWFADYRAAQRAQGERIRLISPTRQRIEWLVESVKPWECLETNVYSKPTRMAAELRLKDRQNRILEFLLDAVRPAVVLAHGRAAHRFFDLHRGDVEVLRVPHLFNASAASVRHWADQAKSAVEARGRHSPSNRPAAGSRG